MKRNRSYFSVNTGLTSHLAPSNSVLFNIFYYLCCLFIFPIFFYYFFCTFYLQVFQMLYF